MKNRDEQVALFRQKNLARKNGKQNGSARERSYARGQRRFYHGKFGNLNSELYNEMIPGTTGTTRRGGR